MQRLLVPESSVEISRLGFGCARIFGGSEIFASARLIEAALQQGITHFDTAPSYGSEAVLGDVLAGVNGVTIASKIGIPRSANHAAKYKRFVGPLYRATLRPLLSRAPSLKSRLLKSRVSAPQCIQTAKRRLTRDDILRELDESLRALRRSALDIYMVHEPDGIELTDELQDIFASLKRSGTIKAFGLAYGGAPVEKQFGQIMQGRYDRNAQGITFTGQVRIHHGVIRVGMQTPAPTHANGAAMLVRDALWSDHACAVLVSVSTTRQLRQLTENLSW